MDNIKQIIIYNTASLEKIAVLEKATYWYNKGYISIDKLNEIKHRFMNDIQKVNIFSRIGVFIFTAIGFAFFVGYFSIILAKAVSYKSEFVACLLIDFIIAFVSLEIAIKKHQKYKSGLDDALLYIGLGLLLSFLFSITNNLLNQNLIVSCLFLVILMVSALRYLDQLVAASAYLCAIVVIFYLFSNLGELAQDLMPFIIMIFSGIVFYISIKYKNHEKYRFWRDSIVIIETLSLISFYLSGNYYIIRNASEELFHLDLRVNEDIPFAMIFYIFTALVPIIYIFFGLKNKNRIYLNAGLIILGASVLTFKYYFSLGHPEISLTIGGIVLISIAYISIRYLKIPKHNLCYLEDKSISSSLLDLETIIISQTIENQSQTMGKEKGFNGGDFGGGGSGSEF